MTTTFTDESIMLTLAALTYRGFQDALEGPAHERIVSGAVLGGLSTLPSVKDQWELVWGPATDRDRGLAIDTNMMYVVRSRSAPSRLVVAIRGTNPLSIPDWVFGDFWVGQTVPWPYATTADPAVISKSTALGLRALQAMRSGPPAIDLVSKASAFVANTLAAIERALRGGPPNVPDMPAWFQTQTQRIGQAWLDVNAHLENFSAQRKKAQTSQAAPIAPANLRPKLETHASADGRRDLLSFLRAEAERSAGTPLEVVVAGHSKGGALAPAVAVWLKDALNSGEPGESWDPSGRARVACYAFAGPTPGDAGFARRIEQTLGQNFHHLRNMNDIVTHAWQVDELREIPDLYGDRTRVFKPLVKLIVDEVAERRYQHAQLGVTPFKGELGDGKGMSPKRDFATEFVYQHLDGYLAKMELHAVGISAATFFL